MSRTTSAGGIASGVKATRPLVTRNPGRRSRRPVAGALLGVGGDLEDQCAEVLQRGPLGRGPVLQVGVDVTHPATVAALA